MTDREEIDKKIKEIDEILKELRNKHNFEYVFFWSKYDKAGAYDYGSHHYAICDKNNLGVYSNSLLALKADITEKSRFKEVIHLPEFRVVCFDDLLNGDVMSSLNKNGGDWVKTGEGYVVENIKQSLGQPGLTFSLRKLDGTKLSPPFPYEGYHSSRFRLFNYDKVN